jgi:hypothetical protein
VEQLIGLLLLVKYIHISFYKQMVQVAEHILLVGILGNPAYTISSGNSDANGYGNFEYAVPSGYYALNTKNLAEYG